MPEQKRILIVEDQELWTGLIRMSLGGVDAELVFASDFDQASQLLRKGPYVLLILDNTLHEIQNASIELLRAARLLMNPVPPVIVHSQDLPFMIEQKVKELGATYIRKNQRGPTLREKVDELLA